MADKYYTRTREIDGATYTAQFNGLAAALEAVDNCTLAGTGQLSVVRMTQYILENVIVEPAGLSADDFDDMETLNRVVAFGREVMQGRFRTRGNEGETK